MRDLSDYLKGYPPVRHIVLRVAGLATVETMLKNLLCECLGFLSTSAL